MGLTKGTVSADDEVYIKLAVTLIHALALLSIEALYTFLNKQVY